MKRNSLGLVLTMALAVACARQPASSPAKAVDSRGPSPVAVGSRAPSFVRTSVDGSRIEVPSARHDATILHFGATWSTVDQRLWPRLQEIAYEFPKVQVILVSVDDEAKAARGFAEWGVRYPIVWDKDHELARAYSMTSEPSVYVIDRAGVIRVTLGGYHEGDDLAIEESVRALSGPNEPGATCLKPLRTSSMATCLRQCERFGREATRCGTPDCKAHCDPMACEARCVGSNSDGPRSQALAFCRSHHPNGRGASCVKECHSDEMNDAFHTCRRESAHVAKLDAECEAICGLKACYAKCP